MMENEVILVKFALFFPCKMQKNTYIVEKKADLFTVPV